MNELMRYNVVLQGGDMATVQGYSVAWVAENLDVSRATIHNWINADRFPESRKLNRGKVTSAILISPEDFEKVRLEEIEKVEDEIKLSKARLEKLKKAAVV